MASMDQDCVFVNEAIRDTSAHNSLVSFSGEFIAKTIIVKNSLNQIATMQLQGSDAGASTWLDIGAPSAVAASTNIYLTVSDFFPNFRVVATCAIAPSSGNLNVCIIKAVR